MKKQSQSILKKKKNTNGTSKRNVSFGGSTTSTFKKDVHEHSNGNGNGKGKGKNKGSKFNDMAVDEEDALDPTNHKLGSNEETKIREARAARALKRHTNESNEDFDEEDTRVLKRDSFQGEENVDERFSLLHDSKPGSGDDPGDGDCPIEPFNMTAEREDGTGYFDGDTYVFRRNNDDEEDDAWLEDLDGEKGKPLASEKGPSSDFVPTKKKSESLNDQLTKEEAYDELIPLLSSDSETILQALSRYGAIVKREKKQNKKDSTSMKALTQITELCNICMMKFDDGGNIYDSTRLKMQAFLQQSDREASLKRKSEAQSNGNGKRPKTDDSSVKEKKQINWEYRGNEDNLIHGPYSTQQMVEWIRSGYFVGSMAVDVRIVADKTSNTKIGDANQKKEDTVNDLLDDLEDSDNEDSPKEKANEPTDNDWSRSDAVNFESYL